MISDALRIDIEKWASTKDARPLFAMAKSGRLTREMVTSYIANVTYMISHTPKHLRMARDLAHAKGDAPLVAHFEHKLEEEDGHEAWGNEDLESLARIVATPRAQRITPSIRAYAEYLPTLLAEDPAFYLAHIAFVEYITILLGPSLIADIEANCAVSRSSMSIVDKHIDLDKEHVEEGFGVIDDLVGDPRKLSPMRKALASILAYFDRFCEEITVAELESGEHPIASHEQEIANVSAA